jgi:hypothetical protein
MVRRTFRLSQIMIVGLLTVTVAVIAGCGSENVGRSNLGTKIGDREFRASLDGGAFISSQGDAAVVTFSGGELIVERGSVRLDGKELAKLPEEAKKVEIDYTAGKLTVAADGESLLATELLPK